MMPDRKHPTLETSDVMLRTWAAVLLLVTAPPALAATAKDLGDRIETDGSVSDFTEGEKLFGFNTARGVPEESTFDSRWGPNNDLNQIRVTWDAHYLYVAGEGTIWGNNMVVLLDVLPDRGLTTMRDLNSWSRNFTFSADFRPDLFLATWDGNASPHLLLHVGGLQVDDQQVGDLFTSVATFSQNQSGRAMEFRIPWNTVFLGTDRAGGPGTDTVVVQNGAARDTLELLPNDTIKIAGVITAGGNNTGGPDSAPDNSLGHSSDGSCFVVIDNYTVIALDQQGDRPGIARPDSVPDFGIEPHDRVSYKAGFEPPIVPPTLQSGCSGFVIDAVTLDRPAFKPDLGESVGFDATLSPRLDPDDPVNQGREVTVSAFVYDLRGRLVRQLYFSSPRAAVDVRQGPACVCGSGTDPCDCLDRWNGRDDNGQIVDPGVYILSVVLEPNANRKTKAVVVVR